MYNNYENLGEAICRLEKLQVGEHEEFSNTFISTLPKLEGIVEEYEAEKINRLILRMPENREYFLIYDCFYHKITRTK